MSNLSSCSTLRANFARLGQDGACCRRLKTLQLGETGPGSAQEPCECAAACAAQPRCSHFSHSRKWRDCIYCRGCCLERSLSSSEYTSWQRSRVHRRRGPKPPPPPPTPTSPGARDWASAGSSNCTVKGTTIALLRSNPVYRVGDLFYHVGDLEHRRRNSRDRQAVQDRAAFAGSVMRCYLESAARRQRECDPSLLRDCCDQHQPATSARARASDNVVLHFRAGDKSGWLNSKGLAKSRLTRLLRDVTALNVTGSIDVVTSFNFSPNPRLGSDYDAERVGTGCSELQRTISHLEEKGFNVVVHSNSRVDADICHLLQAPRVVASTGILGFLAVCSAARTDRCASPLKDGYACEDLLDHSSSSSRRGHARIIVPIISARRSAARKLLKCTEGLFGQCNETCTPGSATQVRSTWKTFHR